MSMPIRYIYEVLPDDTDRTDPAWPAAEDYLWERPYLDIVSAAIQAAFLAGARTERRRQEGAP